MQATSSIGNQYPKGYPTFTKVYLDFPKKDLWWLPAHLIMCSIATIQERIMPADESDAIKPFLRMLLFHPARHTSGIVT